MEPHGAAADHRRRRAAARLRLHTDASPSSQLDGHCARHARSRHPSASHLSSGAASAARPASIPSKSSSPQRLEQLQRPVMWAATRSEDMLALSHSRGQIQFVELGCKRDGTFTGLRVRLVGDGGAYPGIGSFLPSGTRRMSNGTYRFTGIQFDVVVAATNTTPMGAYRGAGRPGGDSVARTDRRSGLDRAGHRPDRASSPQPADRRRVSVHHAHRHQLRQRRVHHSPRRGHRVGRVRRVATRTGAAAGPRRSPAARHRCVDLRRDHRRRQHQRVRRRCRSTTTARRRSTPAHRRTARGIRRRSR